MLGGGYFTPLPGYMNLQDALGVANEMRTSERGFLSGTGAQPGRIRSRASRVRSRSRCATPT